jgi:hypothetical protein
MTAKKNPPTPTQMLADLRAMVIDPGAGPTMLLRAIDLAYEIGKSEGHFDGARRMAEDLSSSFSKSLDRIAAKAAT